MKGNFCAEGRNFSVLLKLRYFPEWNRNLFRSLNIHIIIYFFQVVIISTAELARHAYVSTFYSYKTIAPPCSFQNQEHIHCTRFSQITVLRIYYATVKGYLDALEEA